MGKSAEAFVEWHSSAPGRGVKEEIAAGDLIAWLSAVHVAQLDAGDQFDGDAWDFFHGWYGVIGG